MNSIQQQKIRKTLGRPMLARSKLLAAARVLFLDQGLDVSLDAIASKAGTTRQTLYNHFSSKTLLLIEVFDSFKTDLDVPFLNSAMDNKTLEGFLMQMGHAIQMHFYNENVLKIQRLLIVALIQLPEVLPAIQQRRTGTISARLGAALAQAHARGVLYLEQPEEGAQAFVGAAIGPMYTAALLGEKIPSALELHRLNQEVCRIFMHAWKTPN